MNRNVIYLASAAALIAFYTFFIAPLEDKRDALKEELFIQYKSLQKHERFISSTQGAEEDLAKVKEDLSEKEQFIITESDASLGFAKLQTKVQDMADSAGLSITSLKPLQPVDQKEGYKRLPLFMDCRGDMKELSSFLNFLDSTWEFIAVDSLQVSVAPQGALRIKIQLSGLMKS